LPFGELLRRLAVLIRPHWKTAVLVGTLLLCTLALELALPPIVARAMNNAALFVSGKRSADEILRSVAFLGLLYLALSGARSAIGFTSGVRRARFTQTILWDLRRMMYDAMQRMSFSFFDKSQSGQLISRLTTDVQRVARFINHALFAALESSVVLVGVTVYMFVKSPLLALVALSTVPATLYIVVQSARKMRPLFKDARDTYGDVTTALAENIAGVKVVRAFAREDDEISRFSGRADGYITKILRAMDLWAMRTPPAMFIYGLNAPLILVVGGWLVFTGRMELGTLTAFILYMDRMSWRVQMVGDIVNSTARAGAAADRIYEVLDAEPEIRQKPDACPLPDGKGEVVFDGVNFAYDGATPVLENIKLRVQPGQTVALIGATGSGKSTLVSLIPRFYDVTAGSIRIDGCDVRDARLDDLRREVSLIFQETFLFSATVRENIAYGRPDASLEEVVACATAAQAHEFITAFDQGYDTIVGERGVTLSGGQRQRIAIARALLADPRILVMDDATASVDSATERLIQGALVELSKGRTTFVIAHRISTVRRADLIVVLNRGRIAEMGTHVELLAAGGIYREICDVQLAEAGRESAVT
jgi:ATP-binding cassette subfamily B protein